MSRRWQNCSCVVVGRDSGDRLAALSLQLNDIQRQLQQIVCLGKPGSGTSNTGGWCSDAVGHEHRTDDGLARALAVLLFGRTAASLGDGLGDYGRAIVDTGLVERVDSFDGAPFIEEATAGRVRFIDLAVPQYWLPVYDWTVCLEVLEHIPARHEATALDNLVRPARLGVVLSWARPGQAGFAHVNPRPVYYVMNEMARRGFRVDEFWTTKLRDAATFSWFKFTINVYRRTDHSLKLFDWQTNWTDVVAYKYNSVSNKTTPKWKSPYHDYNVSY